MEAEKRKTMSEGLLKTIYKRIIKTVKDIKVRENYGIFAGIVGIICNLILFACKFFAGIITSSVSISADAFNNLSDAGSSIVTLAGFKMAGKPADTDHPFGHGRIEYIAGMIVSAVIIVMAIELFKDSVIKIFQPEAMEFSVVSVVILAGFDCIKTSGWHILIPRWESGLILQPCVQQRQTVFPTVSQPVWYCLCLSSSSMSLSLF